MKTTEKSRFTPNIQKKPSSLRYFQEGPKPVDLSNWQLDISGEVKNPQSLEYKQLTALPAEYHHRRTVCVCLWTIKRHWYGVKLKHVLELAGVDLNNDSLFLRQLSNGTEKGKYDTTIHMRSAIERNAILAWAVDDEPLTLEAGYPLRLIDFGLFNYKCVKALQQLEVTREHKLGYWEARAGYELDGTVQSKKYYSVDLQRKIWFDRQGEIMDEDI